MLEKQGAGVLRGWQRLPEQELGKWPELSPLPTRTPGLCPIGLALCAHWPPACHALIFRPLCLRASEAPPSTPSPHPTKSLSLAGPEPTTCSSVQPPDFPVFSPIPGALCVEARWDTGPITAASTPPLSHGGPAAWLGAWPSLVGVSVLWLRLGVNSGSPVPDPEPVCSSECSSDSLFHPQGGLAR